MTYDTVAGRVLGAPSEPRTLEELAAVAREQRGLVTRRQCLWAGLSDRAIRWRLARDRWRIVHHGVYLTSPGRDDWHTSALAAQLAVSDSAWSHRTAAHVHGILREAPRVIELVVDRTRRVAVPQGVVVHRRVSADATVDELHWPWRTTVEETILEISQSGSADELMAMLGRAFQRRLTSETTLRSALAARRAHRWRGLLDVILADLADGAESAMEVRYVRDVERAHGLPVGRRQRVSPSGSRERHDVAYDEQRVLVELDGRLGHEGFEAQKKDGRRDRRGAAVGWLSTRAYWEDVAVTPCALAVDMGAILQTRGWDDQPHPCRRRACVIRERRSSGVKLPR